MRKAKLVSRLLLAWAIWLVAAIVVGSTAAFVLGGHGAAVFVVFALAVGVFGAIGSSVILCSKHLSSLRLPARAGIAALAAFSPMLVLALYGLLAKADYPLGDALQFLVPPLAGAIAVGVLSEWLVHQARANSDAPAT
jgi:hypothetical protein